MILEEVQSHPYRHDIYLNKIIASNEEVKEEDKDMINKMLLKEFAINYS